MITITIIIIIIMHNRFLTIGAPFRVPPFWARIWTPNLGPQFRADLDSSTNQHESANTFTLHAANIYMCIVVGLLSRPWYAAAEAYRRPPHGHPSPNASCKDLQDPVIIASCRATPTSSPCSYRRWHWPTTTSIFKHFNMMSSNPAF